MKEKIVFNETQVQLDTSSSCGLHVIYFIVNRFLSPLDSFEEVLNDIFTSDLNKNERLVIEEINLLKK